MLMLCKIKLIISLEMSFCFFKKNVCYYVNTIVIFLAHDLCVKYTN